MSRMRGLLEGRIGPATSVLDLGCGLGGGGLTRDLRFLCVDAWAPYLDKLKGQAHTMAGELPAVLDRFRARSFDVVLLLDVVEHLEKDDATKTMVRAKELARQRVLVYTPDGELFQPPFNAWGEGHNPWQEHKCGFVLAELERLGFSLIKRYPSYSEYGGDHEGMLVEWVRDA